MLTEEPKRALVPACGTITRVTPEHVMSAKRAAGYCGGALLLLAWLSAADGVMRQTPDVSEPAAPVDTAGTTTLAADVQAQTLRLKTRLAAAPAPQEPFRNPFTFAPRPSRERREPPPRVEADVPAPPAGQSLEPAIELIGIAQSESPKGVVRTAIISALSGELFLVKEGETIVARYRVGTVATDTVELIDLHSGSVRRLALRE